LLFSAASLLFSIICYLELKSIQVAFRGLLFSSE